MVVLIAGLVLFLGVHLARVVAPGWRERFIAQRGDGAWKGLYSVISIIGFILLIYGYGLAKDDAGQVYVPIDGARGLTLIAMPVALILVLASQFPAGYLKRAIRHPMIVGVVLWSAVHLAANGDTASVLLFGGFFVWAVMDAISAYRRPYAAPASVSVLYDIVAVGSGLVLTYLFVAFLHEWLFGVAPVVIG